MAKKIGNLAVVISASTSGLQKTLANARKSVAGFGRDIAGIAGSIVNPVTLAAAGLGAVISVGGLQDVAASIDDTAKAADRLGLTTQALVGLKHGAELAGVAGEELTGSFQTMLKNTSLAAIGLGKAGKAFDALNIDPSKLKVLSTENQFKVLAERLSQVKDPADKVRLSMQLFGDSGAKLIPFLSEGAAGLEAMQVEAEALGLTFDRVDAAKVELANDALSRVKAVMTGIAQALVIELAPYVTALANQFVNAAKDGKGWGDIVVTAVEKVTLGVSYLGNAVQVVQMGWYGLKAAVAQVLSFITQGLQKFGEAILQADQWVGGVLPDGIRKAMEETNTFAGQLAQGFEDVATEAAQSFNDIAEAPWASDKVRAYFADVRKQAEDAAKDIAANAPKPEVFDPKMVDQVSGKFKKGADEIKSAAKEIERTFDRSENSLILVGSADSFSASAKSSMQELVRQQKQQLDIQKRQIERLDQIAKNTEPLDDEDVIDY